ncbi:MAG: response regulator transcription factor [Burkholderiales bacterium]|nr:response regulator transcription factor [Burkholderiales bacterium]
MSQFTSLRVLVVDDDEDIRDLVATYLGSQGVQVFEAESEAGLLDCVARDAPDVILLDVNLGREDGFAIARRLRASWHGGLLMVTGRGDTVDRVVGLEIGADDYITKPFELRELLARIRSVGRRTTVTSPVSAETSNSAGQPTDALRFEEFTLDLQRRTLLNERHETVALTTGEYHLLKVLAENAGRILSRDQLLQQTHHRDAAPFDRTIDVQVGRLRRKLGDNGKEPRLIKAVRGAGYVLSCNVTRSGPNDHA